MKTKLMIVCLLLAVSTSLSAEYVSGYTKSNGTYVQGYHRSTANSTKSDNYSTKGNINPYTGKSGTKTYSDYNNYGSSSSSSKSKSNSTYGY